MTRNRSVAAAGAAITLLCALAAGAVEPGRTQDAAPPRPAGEAPGADPPEITPAAKESIRRGLKFLVDAQNRDGSWRTNGGTGNYPVAMTSLAGLALLASGSSPTQGPYARNVSSALTFILKSARRDGLIAQIEEENHCMHGHGYALLFLAECYGMEEDAQRQAQIRLALQRAVELTARSQSAAGGWLYTPDANSDEGSVTVTQVQGLRACRNAGIAVPKKVVDAAMSYIEKSANKDGGIRYQIAPEGQSRPAITAAAVVCYYNAGLYEHPPAVAALRFVEEQLSPRNRDASRYLGHYYYAHLYMAQAMYLSGEQKWSGYFPAMRDTLVESQLDDGSWMGDHVGSTYGTAVALMILQLPYKHLPIMQR